MRLRKAEESAPAKFDRQGERCHWQVTKRCRISSSSSGAFAKSDLQSISSYDICKWIHPSAHCRTTRRHGGDGSRGQGQIKATISGHLVDEQLGDAQMTSSCHDRRPIVSRANHLLAVGNLNSEDPKQFFKLQPSLRRQLRVVLLDFLGDDMEGSQDHASQDLTLPRNPILSIAWTAHFLSESHRSRGPWAEVQDEKQVEPTSPSRANSKFAGTVKETARAAE
jgi:hypothetical protein